jgi:hypothetical protein
MLPSKLNSIAKSNFITKSMVEINPPSIGQPIKTFGHHMIGDEMLLVAKVVATKNIFSPIVWQQKNFNCHTIGDKKNLVIASLATKIFP